MLNKITIPNKLTTQPLSELSKKIISEFETFKVYWENTIGTQYENLNYKKSLKQKNMAMLYLFIK